MNAESRTARNLALLVGSNPLPNYLAEVVLKPEEVVLLYSPETAELRNHLRTVLHRRQVTVKDKCIADATDVRKIRDACQDLDIDHLHYSGGTKPMAAHARTALRLQDCQASYLDERKGLLRFDDGYDVALDQHDLGLSLDLLLGLHGIEAERSGGNGEGMPTDNDVTAIAQYVLSRPEAAEEWRDALRPGDRRRNITQAKLAPWTPPNGLSLSVPQVPGGSWKGNQYKRWDDFLCGGWLEAWTARVIRDCLADSKVPVEVNVRCKRDLPTPTEFEIDVALIRGHRLYVVSCTTDSTKALCKSKLFEVAMRARQMGGDLARSALVCLIDGGNEHGLYVEQLRADIASVWDAPNVPRVYGLADLREWAGTAGSPNTSSLKEWLDS